jgi:hypothetical protein
VKKEKSGKRMEERMGERRRQGKGDRERNRSKKVKE